MNLFINDLPCTALTGQTVGKAARLNHSHVGYVCAGHGVCQACYVTVQEGRECLSPLSEIEKAFFYLNGRFSLEDVLPARLPLKKKAL